MRIAVVDDDPEFRSQIVEYIAEFYGGNTERFKVGCFDNGLDFLSEYKCNYDIVLLDIQMPGIYGIDVAGEIRKNDTDVVIMFITQTANFALRGYEVNALDYILKPLHYETEFKPKFERAVKKAESAVSNNDRCLLLNDDNGGFVRIKLNEFIYVVKEKDTAVFYTMQGVFRKRTPLFKIEEMLENTSVAVANSGCLVNLAFVKNVTDNNIIVLTNGDTAVLSRGKKKAFFDKFLDYVNQSGGKA